MYVNACCKTYYLIPDRFTRIFSICAFKPDILSLLSWPSRIQVESSFLPGPAKVISYIDEDRQIYLTTGRRMCSCFILHWSTTCPDNWLQLNSCEYIIQCFQCSLLLKNTSKATYFMFMAHGLPCFLSVPQIGRFHVDFGWDEPHWETQWSWSSVCGHCTIDRGSSLVPSSRSTP